MGISSDGCLYYGFAIADENGCGEMTDVDLAKFFGLTLEEYEEDEYGDEYEDFDFDEYLYKDAGLAARSDEETKEERDARWEAQDQIKNNCPVSLEMFCSYDYSMYILTIKGYGYSVARGSTAEITSLAVDADKVDAAKEWCEKRGIKWQEPKWLLCSLYG